ncbi:MAG: MBOAT family O-acyltransferase, partial [Chitinophagaceae bacterium]
VENLFAVYAYAIVIYCDFSGYSDIAIGIARWLGFTIPTNFLSPYQSKSITEFWRRWHISLSSWLRDYLYIPLGGNRNATAGTWLFAGIFFAGVFFSSHSIFGLSYVMSSAIAGGLLLLFSLPAMISRESRGMAANMNLLTTMLLGGFWHGASWNFIIWGALHGIALAVHKLWILLTGKRLHKINNQPLYNLLALLLTFHFVCFCWIFFHARDMETAMNMISQIRFNLDFSVWNAFTANYYAVLVMMGIGYAIHFIPDNYADKVIARFPRLPLAVYVLIFFVFLLVYGYFKSAEPVMPIYLQF